MARAKIHINNSRSRVEGVRSEIFELLRHELSFPTGQPGWRRHMQHDGSIKTHWWDGYRRLLQTSGNFPSGLVPRLMRLLRKWGVGFQVIDHRTRPAENIPLWAYKAGWQLRDYQTKDCDAAEKWGRGVIDSPPRCISGDMRLQVNRGGKTFWLSIRDLVHRFNGGAIRCGKGAVAHWNLDIPTQIRARDGEGYVRLFDVNRAWESGEKELIQARLSSGFTLAASEEHLVMTSNGWRVLGELRLGDFVIAEMPRTKGFRQPKKNYPFRCNLVGHPFAGRRGRKPDKGHYCVATHRLAYEAHLNSLGLEEFVRLLRDGPAEGLQFLDPAEFAVHHKDDNHRNNRLSNLEAMDHVEHWRHHGAAGGWKNAAFTTGPIEVVELDYCGAADTYDIEVPGAGNFLSDRIVVHNSGKTVMMAELLRRTSCRTVITAPTKPIAEQTYEKFIEMFQDWTHGGDVSEDFYLLTGGAPKSIKAQRALRRATVFVATAETAVGMPGEWWKTIESLIVDERHHQAAKTYHKMSDKAVNAYYRWGFTGTNYRSNPGEQVALEACLGRTIAKHSIGEMTASGVLVPAIVQFWPVDYDGLRTLKYAKSYPKGIVQSDVRNEMIALAASQLVSEGRKVLVLVARLEHGEQLAQIIHGSQFVKGEDGDEVRRAVSSLDAGDLRCLIGSPVVGEGLDCPSADALVYAKGHKAKVTHVQDVFRVMTAHEGKKNAIIIDFADRHNNSLVEHSVERLRHYREMGMEVSVLPRPPIDSRQMTL